MTVKQRLATVMALVMLGLAGFAQAAQDPVSWSTRPWSG